MNRASTREHAGELIVTHARPMPHTADIKMHERRSRGRIVAHAPTLQTQACIPQLLQGGARDKEIHCLAQGMLAELRHAAAAPPQHGVGSWGAVAADHVDGPVAPDLTRHLPDHVKQTRIHMNVFVLSPVAEEPVQSLERLLVIAPVALVSDRNIFVGVNVMKGERAGVAVRDRAFEPVVAKRYYQGDKPRTRPDPRGKN